MSHHGSKTKRLPFLPTTQSGWRDVALRYLERFEAPAERVRRVLKERARVHKALDDQVAQMIDRVIEDLEHAHLIDDKRYAEMRAQSLARRGKGRRLIRQDLSSHGVAGVIASSIIEEGEWSDSEAALTSARRKRLGPFRTGRAVEMWETDREKQRQKELAALLRAGHNIALARIIVDAKDEAALIALLEGEDE